MAKRKKKKVGKYGESIISEFSNAVNALRHRYKTNFPDMEIYLHFNALGKNFIFQKIQSFPLQKIFYKSETHSVEFKSEWKSGGRFSYLFSDSTFDVETHKSGQTVDWGEVANFKPRVDLLRGNVSDNEHWESFDDGDDIDASMNIRIDEIKSINMYDWGFELIGEIISLLAIDANFDSPIFNKIISMNIDSISFDFDRVIGGDTLVVRWNQPGYEKQIPPDFNNQLFDCDIKKGNTEFKVKNIGQKCLDNLILDDA